MRGKINPLIESDLEAAQTTAETALKNVASLIPFAIQSGHSQLEPLILFMQIASMDKDSNTKMAFLEGLMWMAYNLGKQEAGTPALIGGANQNFRAN